MAKVKFRSIYDSRRIWKMVFVIVSVMLVVAFLYISNRLVSDLAVQERERMEIWADATKQLVTSSTGDEYMPEEQINFLLSILERNHTIPVMLVDEHDEILQQRNFQLPEAVDSVSPFAISDVNMAYLRTKLQSLKNSNNQIVINIDSNTKQYLYYEDSILLRRLALFPYIELVVMLVFIVVVYFALISVKKAEQNKVWVGLSKETAHQLGTPISSLMAWMQMLDTMGVDADVVKDMDKDVHRLSVIADRFSKIGSKPEMEMAFINESVTSSMEYMRSRISKRVDLNIVVHDEQNCGVMLCQSLFEWVMENLTKNAVDAMQSEGKLTITVSDGGNMALIDVKDTGKGIARKNFKNVFNPGYTTKKRGWGLGLTLVKRIIEEYHGGKIYVKESELGQGTTFRIELPKMKN
ncbi:MAG: sensor histidine kinase [Muribaculaceae bacterium]